MRPHTRVTTKIQKRRLHVRFAFYALNREVDDTTPVTNRIGLCKFTGSQNK